MSTIDEKIVIRPATASDRDAIVRLAQRDTRPAPEGQLLVAEVDGEIRAAVSMEGGSLIADPFHPTADLLALLEARSGQLRSRRRRRQRIVARTPAATTSLRERLA